MFRASDPTRLAGNAWLAARRGHRCYQRRSRRVPTPEAPCAPRGRATARRERRSCCRCHIRIDPAAFHRRSATLNCSARGRAGFARRFGSRAARSRPGPLDHNNGALVRATKGGFECHSCLWFLLVTSVRKTHDPKVGGSNPSATNPFIMASGRR